MNCFILIIVGFNVVNCNKRMKKMNIYVRCLAFLFAELEFLISSCVKIYCNLIK